MKTWKFSCRRDCNRFREMLTSLGIATTCRTIGMTIHVWEI